LLYALSGPAIWLWGRLRRGGGSSHPDRPELSEDARREVLSPLPPPPSPPDDIPYRR
jgi:hypothetical protein